MTEPIALLQKLIQINSVNGNELAVAKLLQAELEAADIPTKLIPYTEDRVNLIAELNHGDRVLGFTGHEDVVSPGDESAGRTHLFPEKSSTMSCMVVAPMI